MKKLLYFILGLSLVVTTTIWPQPANAQGSECNLSWDFEIDLGEWGGMSDFVWQDGEMVASPGSQANQLTRSEILSYLGYPSDDYIILPDGVSFSWDQSVSGNAFTTASFSGGIHKGFTNNGRKTYTTAEATVPGAALDLILFIRFVVSGSGTVTFDNISVSIPCENIQPLFSGTETPTPTAVSTATPAATATPTAVPTETPVPTPTSDIWGQARYTKTTGMDLPIGLPGPRPIPEPPPGMVVIDASVFWDYQLLSDFISIIMTMFVLVKNHYIMQVVLIVAAISLALVFLVRIVRGRQVNI